MYKLIVVAGKLRGKEFTLKDGENILGRDPSCDIEIAVDGVSKRHCSMTVSGDAAYIQDLGSSNGTFLNGKIVKRATVTTGDKLALPDTILHVVHVKEKKVIVKKSVAKDKEEETVDDFSKIPPAPAALPQKLIWVFKYKLMTFIHGINQEYEWRSMLAVLYAAFVFTTIALTIFPVLQDSKRVLLIETAKRGAHFAEEIARMNSKFLEQKNLDRVDSNFLDTEEDVASYELFDLEGRIVRPMGKLNEYVSDYFSNKAKEWAVATASVQDKPMFEILNDGEIGIAQKIMAYNPRVGISEAVGIIAIRFTPKSLAIEASKNSSAFLESLVTAGIVAIFFYGVFYFLTIRPIEELRIQMDEGLRGKRRNIETHLLFNELNPLKNILNTTLQRVRELQNDESEAEFDEVEDVEPYVNTLTEFLRGAGVPAMILDGDKKLRKINLEAEDVTSIRETGSEGMSLIDVAREQGFAATVIELCDNCASNSGMAQDGVYELQGAEYRLHVSALMGKDGFAKAFYITFLKEE